MAEVVSDIPVGAIRQAVGTAISAENIAKLTNIAQVARCHVGEYLFREGQSHGDLYIMLDGKVDLLMTVPGRGPQRILTVGTGELLAWSAMIGAYGQTNGSTGSDEHLNTSDGADRDSDPHAVMTCDAVSTTSSTLLRLNGQRLRGLFASEPQLGFEFMLWLAGGVAKRLTATRLQMLDLFARENQR
ncbi:MAG: cyclic nucleotide-binding domain-containing protein [Pirellulaceae bacterium]|nr:cyclic nucleotide-binding domain-containing protein [Pirellulaceae bacterium]